MRPGFATLGGRERRAALVGSGLVLRMGPFNVAIEAQDGQLETQLAACYPDYVLGSAEDFCHARVRCELRRAGARFWHQEGCVRIDDGAMFSDYPPGHALPYVEWGINWCIATRCHFLLMLHAAVVERGGRALVLPGLPGAGKSTLAAYLCHRGWRLLSDEFCLMRPGSREIIPFPRLVPLKNESIDVIRASVPEARIGPSFSGTRKGTVAHVTPPGDQATTSTTATAVAVVRPRYAAGANAVLAPLDKAHCFVELSKNAFNYQILGEAAFDSVAALADGCSAHTLEYGELPAAAALLEALIDDE